MIAVIDYDAGNLASVRHALATVGGEVRMVRHPSDAAGARAIVVPGVGHFQATAPIDAGWRAFLRSHVDANGPLLGICLGMQWLFEGSDEAPGCQGLGLLGGACRRLAGAVDDGGQRIKVPHVGWNSLAIRRPSAVLNGIDDGAFVYFTHSYAAPVSDDCVAATDHGEPFAAVVERGRVWGAQFHPEKSGDVGLRILRNFVESSAC